MCRTQRLGRGKSPLILFYAENRSLSSPYNLGSTLLFLTHEKKHVNHALPFGPRNLRNSDKIPSTPAALSLFTSFKAASTSSRLKYSIHSDFSTQLFIASLRSFFYFKFF